MFLVVSSRIDDDGKLKSLADLFKPPFDIMFTGTFAEVRVHVYVYMYTCTKCIYMHVHTLHMCIGVLVCVQYMNL